MPIWSEILNELIETDESGQKRDFDGVLRKYLVGLREHTGRDAILYASCWLHKPITNPRLIQIVHEDVHALMEVCYEFNNESLDIIVHSPGGSVAAAESIVEYLRSRFSDIRVIIPHMAMSAATMIACSADRIVMGQHSFLGPTDPQMTIVTSQGLMNVPAQAVLDEFRRAGKECLNPALRYAWKPILDQFPLTLITQCESALALSRELVKTWLDKYMFRPETKLPNRSGEIANWLSDHKTFKIHERPIPRSQLMDAGLVVEPLEQDHEYQDLVLSIFHVVSHMFASTGAVKVVQNHLGRAFIRALPA